MAQPLFPNLKPVLPGRAGKRARFLFVGLNMAAKKGGHQIAIFGSF
jgi:hypothetical protein